MEHIINLMKKYNFTEYETKVYIALLEIGKSTGYEISKMSSVPRSKVYNTLESLLKKGLIQKTINNQVLYTAIPVDEFINMLSDSLNKDMINLKQSLNQHNTSTFDHNEIWNIDGYDNVIIKAKNLIKNAQDELLIQIWKEDIDNELMELLKAAQERIENFILILFSETGNYEMSFNRYYAHYFETEKLEEMKSRWINIVSNGNNMMMSTIYNHTLASGLTTQFEPMVFLAREYIVHDAYTANILKNLDQNTKDIFGPHMSKIRDIFKY